MRFPNHKSQAVSPFFWANELPKSQIASNVPHKFFMPDIYHNIKKKRKCASENLVLSNRCFYTHTRRSQRFNNTRFQIRICLIRSGVIESAHEQYNRDHAYIIISKEDEKAIEKIWCHRFVFKWYTFPCASNTLIYARHPYVIPTRDREERFNTTKCYEACPCRKLVVSKSSWFPAIWTDKEVVRSNQILVSAFLFYYQYHNMSMSPLRHSNKG